MTTLVCDASAQGFELIFYGDSITEDWRGTSGGVPWPIGSGSADIFQKHFAAKYRAEVLAIAGAHTLPLAHICGSYPCYNDTLRL